MPPVICVGCGFEVDALGVLQHDGPASATWPYVGAQTVYPTADVDTYNGLSCDAVSGKIWAPPNATTRLVRTQPALIGASEVGNLERYLWSLDSDDFGGGNPWTDSGSAFYLSNLGQLAITNPSSVRPAAVLAWVQVGGQEAKIDTDVDVYTQVVGYMWDGLAVPYPGDGGLYAETRFLGSNEVSPALLDYKSSTPHTVAIARSVGASSSAYFGSFLAPGATVNFGARLAGRMGSGTATNRDGQFFILGWGVEVFLQIWTV